MLDPFAIRAARPDEAEALTALARASKAHWGYPRRWMEIWRETLSIRPDYIRVHPVFVAARDTDLIGVCGISLNGGTAHLEHMWVNPGQIGHGVGRALFLQACDAAGRASAVTLRIEADPHAVGFYRRMGARMVGEIDASVSGATRSLPILEIDLPFRPGPTS